MGRVQICLTKIQGRWYKSALLLFIWLGNGVAVLRSEEYIQNVHLQKVIQSINLHNQNVL